MTVKRTPASGMHSNVVVNLTSREAVALADILFDVVPATVEGASAVGKIEAAAERACIPWIYRPPS